MKCPNCASDVPDASNFCGVCGTDVREARAAAEAAAQTIALDSSEEIQRIRAELAEDKQAEARARESIPDSDPGSTHIDAAPNPRLAETAVDMAAQSNQESPQEPKPTPTPTPKAAPEPASKPIPEPAPKAESTPEPTPVRKAEPKKNIEERPVIQVSGEPIVPSSTEDQGPGPGGMFRETQWFMKAQDPDHIEDIDNYEARDLADQYEDKGEQFSTQVRQAFSLNPDGTPIESAPSTETSEVNFGAEEADGSNTKLFAGVVIALAGIGAAVYFLF